MSELRCSSGIEFLMEYLEGALPAEMRSSLEAHVAGCARCTAYLASYRATPRILREATAAVIPVEVQASLRAVLLAERRRRAGPFA